MDAFTIDTRESLARELAQEQLDHSVEVAMEGGADYASMKIEDFLLEAYLFVDRCIAIGRKQ